MSDDYSQYDYLPPNPGVPGAPPGPDGQPRNIPNIPWGPVMPSRAPSFDLPNAPIISPSMPDSNMPPIPITPNSAPAAPTTARDKWTGVSPGHVFNSGPNSIGGLPASKLTPRSRSYIGSDVGGSSSYSDIPYDGNVSAFNADHVFTGDPSTSIPIRGFNSDPTSNGNNPYSDLKYDTTKSPLDIMDQASSSVVDNDSSIDHRVSIRPKPGQLHEILGMGGSQSEGSLPGNVKNPADKQFFNDGPFTGYNDESFVPDGPFEKFRDQRTSGPIGRSSKPSSGGGGASGGTIMSPLLSTNGVLFPYTPNIQMGFSAEYGSYSPTHSISDFQAYKRTPSPTFTITGDFTAQTDEEARYCLAVIHFFRVVTKMYFGQSENAGVVPPVLLLNGYGNLMLNNLPIIVTNYNFMLENTVDYVQVNIGSGYASEAWIPTKFMLSVAVTVQHTPSKVRQFSMTEFKNGNMLIGSSWNNSSGGWW